MERFFDTVERPRRQRRRADADGVRNRLNKASLAIRTSCSTPDILGVEEVENLTTLQAVAAKVNADAVGEGQPNPSTGVPRGRQRHRRHRRRLPREDLARDGASTSRSSARTRRTSTRTTARRTLNDRPPLVLRATMSTRPARAVPCHGDRQSPASLSGVGDPADGIRVRTKRRKQAE